MFREWKMEWGRWGGVPIHTALNPNIRQHPTKQRISPTIPNRLSLTHMQTPPLNIPGDDLPIHPHSLREQVLKQLFIFLRGPCSGFLNGAVEFMSGVVGSCLFRWG